VVSGMHGTLPKHMHYIDMQLQQTIILFDMWENGCGMRYSEVLH